MPAVITTADLAAALGDIPGISGTYGPFPAELARQIIRSSAVMGRRQRAWPVGSPR
jgi:hypothetical protein